MGLGPALVQSVQVSGSLRWLAITISLWWGAVSACAELVVALPLLAPSGPM